MAQKILFDHFMDGINHAAHDFYDLHPLAGKEFSSDEVLRLFHQFEDIVTRDPFWEKASCIMFIMNDGSLRKLELQRQTYYILDKQYNTSSVWKFFNATTDAYFRTVSPSASYFESSASGVLSYKGLGVSLKYLSVAGKMFEFYGESNYMENIRPHTDILGQAIVKIFGLKKFPESRIKKNQLAQLKEYMESDLRDEDYFFYICKAKEYLSIAETVCPDVKKNPLYQETLNLYDNLKAIESKIKTLSSSFSETIIPAVDAAI